MNARAWPRSQRVNHDTVAVHIGSSVRSAPGTEVGRRPRRRSAGKWQWRSSPASTRSRSGETVSRPGHSASSTTALPESIDRLMESDYPEPLNLGQDRMVTINQLVDIVAQIAGVRVTKKHVPSPQGVRGRNSDNTRLRKVLSWEPTISLEEGPAADLCLDRGSDTSATCRADRSPSGAWVGLTSAT